MHSFYALLLGVGFMWLGERNFAYLRIAVFHIGFIWLSSFMLPRLLKQSAFVEAMGVSTPDSSEFFQ